MYKKWDEVTIRVANLTQKRKMFQKGQAEVENACIASIIYYHLTVVSCPICWLTKLEHLFFHFLWKGHIPLVRHSIYYHQLLNGGLSMPWLLMHRHALRLLRLQRFCDGEQVWLVFVRHDFLQLISLTELQSWIRLKPRKGTWHIECYQVLTALHKVGNAVASSSTLTFYRGLLEGKCDDILGRILGVNEDQLTNLFWRTFRSRPIDNFQRSLAVITRCTACSG